MNLNDIQKKNYTIYILLLPFVMSFSIYFSFVSELFGTLGKNFSVIPHMVGMLVILYEIFKERKIKTNKLINILFLFVLYLNFSSIISAVYRSETLGVLYGETTYDATKGMIIYYTVVFLIFYYNYLILSRFTSKELDRIMKYVVNLILLIGYLQIATLINPFFGKLLDLIDVFDVIRNSDFLLFMDRITLSGSEPATISLIMNVFLVPYILSKILQSDDKLGNITKLALCLPILFFSRSSSVYIMTILNFLIFLYLYFKPFTLSYFSIRKIIFNVIVATILSLSLLVALNSNTTFDNNEIVQKINYLTFEKISDENNQSTLTRMSTVINDLKIFGKYPVFGIGNGMQGYFYNEHLESEYFYSQEVLNLYNGKSGIVNGGPFLPAFISGYGLIGIFFFVIVMKGFVDLAKKRKRELASYYYMFIMSSITFLIGGFMTADIISNYIAIFCMSLPFLKINNEKSEGIDV